MVQLFLLINKLNLKLKCKNHTVGCTFQAQLTESINKQNNLGFTLNNHVLRNHELLCNKCDDCKQQCQHCKKMITNRDWKDHEIQCKKRPRNNNQQNNQQANNANLRYREKMIRMYKFMMKNIFFIKIRGDAVPWFTMMLFWLIYSAAMNLMKLLFIERFLRSSTYFREQNIMLIVFACLFFIGYLVASIQIVVSMRDGYIHGQRSRLHTRFKKYPKLMILIKTFFWMVPSRLLDI